MRTVVLKQKVVDVTVNEADKNKYYGVIVRPDLSSDKKGFITRERFDTGNFKLMGMDKLTNGNGWESFARPTLTDMLFDILSASYWVYEFDTWQELFKWLMSEK